MYKPDDLKAWCTVVHRKKNMFSVFWMEVIWVNLGSACMRWGQWLCWSIPSHCHTWRNNRKLYWWLKNRKKNILEFLNFFYPPWDQLDKCLWELNASFSIKYWRSVVTNKVSGHQVFISVAQDTLECSLDQSEISIVQFNQSEESITWDASLILAQISS